MKKKKCLKLDPLHLVEMEFVGFDLLPIEKRFPSPWDDQADTFVMAERLVGQMDTIILGTIV